MNTAALNLDNAADEGQGTTADYLIGIGMDKIHAYEAELTAHLFQKLQQIPEIKVCDLQLLPPLLGSTAYCTGKPVLLQHLRRV